MTQMRHGVKDESQNATVCFIRTLRTATLSRCHRPASYPHTVEKNQPEASPADAQELAAWLRELKGERSTRSLARDLETDRSQVYRWFGIESWTDKPTTPNGVTLLRILRVLGVRLEPQPPDSLTGEGPLLESLAAMVARQNDLIESLTAEVAALRAGTSGPHAREGQ